GLDVVEGDGGVVANPALRRAARDVVDDAVAGEHLGAAVVHRDGDRNLHRLLALLQDVDQVLVDVECLGHQPQLLAGDLERVLAQMRDGSLCGRHDSPFFDCGGEYMPAYLMVNATSSRLARPARLGIAVTRRRYRPGASVLPAGVRPVSPNA